MEFTEEEVKEKLKELGYVNIPHSKLQEFMRDLQELIEHDKSNSVQSMQSREYDEEEDSNSYSYDETLDHSCFQRTGEIPLQENNCRPRSAFCKERVRSRGYQVAIEKENIVHESTLSSNSNITNNDHSRVRRKVARKHGGGVRVFDETFTDSEVTDITLLEDRLRNLPFSEQPKRPGSSSTTNFSSTRRTPLPAFIRASKQHPHTKGLKKCDPVSRYHQFKDGWQHNKLPGESTHSNLRWQVREQMLTYEAFEKPRHKPMVNDYVVPTEKKRQALRWQVRTALATT